MLSKFSVVKIARISPSCARHLGGLTHLEKYERLRKLCCTSDMAKKHAEIEADLRPRTVEPDENCPGPPPTPLFDMRCKNALIIGGASAVGYEAAHALLQEGALSVILADINQSSGVEATKKLCSTFGTGKASFIMADLVEKPSIEMAFKEIYKFYGQLNIYVNCVGVYNETPQCWDKMIRTNLMGCVRGTLLAYKYLSEQPRTNPADSSVIVNVSSYGSIANVPSMPMFSAASNGINGLTSSFGQDYHFSKTKIRCVTVCAACTDSGLLRNMQKHHYDRSWVAQSTTAMKCCAKQPPKAVGRAIMTAVKYGTNGSIYVVKEGKYYKYNMPDYVKLMRQETILL